MSRKPSKSKSAKVEKTSAKAAEESAEQAPSKSEAKVGEAAGASGAENAAAGGFRTESDSMGQVQVPADAYYGVQTMRAVENFPVSGRRPHLELIRSYVAIKKACAMANCDLGKLDSRRSRAICQAADEILGRGQWLDQWVVDVFQAGAGTSMNMNTNEVLANRALEIIGRQRGEHDALSPNDHVNMSQSTNDTFPTAMHVAVLMVWEDLRRALDDIIRTLATKARLFDRIMKSGRTHLQDAVPIRLGQEFAAYRGAIEEARDFLAHAAKSLREVALGGSAVGTGINTHEQFSRQAVEQLGRIVNLPLTHARDLRLRMQSMLPIATMSAGLRNLALELTRIGNDLRLLSSGPRTGLAEIQLPPVQPGSSIMPGKVNPSMVECLNMICFQVIGNDTAVAMGVQAGQLELNVMMPGMAVAMLDSLTYLRNYLPVFNELCLAGITVDEERCRWYLENSVGMATILNQKIGYLKAAEVAKKAVADKTSALEVIRHDKLLTDDELKAMMLPKKITEPTNPDLG